MTTCTCSMPIPLRAAKGEVYAWRCSQCGLPLPAPDPRDAEIAALKAQIDEDNRVILAVREHNRQLRAALAAGPAALRAMAADYDRKVQMYGVKGVAVTPAILRSADLINAALHVEAAQDAAMKEKP